MESKPEVEVIEIGGKKIEIPTKYSDFDVRILGISRDKIIKQGEQPLMITGNIPDIMCTLGSAFLVVAKMYEKQTGVSVDEQISMFQKQIKKIEKSIVGTRNLSDLTNVKDSEIN